MDNIKCALINLVNRSLGVNTNQFIELDEKEWIMLYKEAINHQIHLLIYSATMKCPNIIAKLKDKWSYDYKYTIVRDVFRLSILERVFQRFLELNISIILLKGLYFKNLYPEPKTRTMCDIDLFVTKQHINGAIKVLEEFGYKKIEDDHTSMHYCFVHDKYITIELHYSLIRSNSFKHAEDLNRIIWEDTNKNTLYLVPSDVNMAIYACFHMANHFMYTGGGFGIRQLCDLILLINKHFDDEKWRAFINKSNELGILSFVLGIIAVCVKFFYFSVPDFIIKQIDLDNEMVDIFLDEIYKSGAFGYSSKIESSNKALAQYSASSNYLSFLFPPRKKLADAYHYARKNVLLLPTAWIHRFINNLTRKDISLAGKIPKMEIVNRHNRLVKWLDIK